jgi:hypothetical protein
MTVVKDTAPRPLRGLSVLSTDPESFVKWIIDYKKLKTPVCCFQCNPEK